MNEERQAQLDQIYSNMKNVIDVVNISLTRVADSFITEHESTALEVVFGHHRMTIAVVDKVFHWGDRICRADFDFNYDYREDKFIASPPKVDFSHGSGGWNSGHEEEVIARLMGNSCIALSYIISHVKENYLVYIHAAKQYYEFQKQASKIWSENEVEQKEASRVEVEKEFERTVSHFGLKKISNDDVWNALQHDPNFGCGDSKLIKVIEPVVGPHGFMLNKVVYEMVKTDLRTFYYKNDKRTSKVKILSDGKNGFYQGEIPEAEALGWYQSRKFFKTTFQTLDAVLNYIKENT